MTKVRPFHTGLHTSDWHRYPAPPYRGLGWTVDFVEQKSGFPQGGEYAGDRLYPFKEVILSARDQTAAQRALDTIFSARNILQGYSLLEMLSGGPQVVSPVEEPTSATSDSAPSERPAFHSSPNIPLACLIAAKVSRRLRFIYALARLEVASSQNPSRINGAWNPDVRSELETRLVEAGVDLSEPIYWNLRGPRTQIEIKRAPEITRLARWAIKNVVRDGQMHVSDAIAYTSFLRSSIAAHSSGDKSNLRVLSVYEVANVQFLARRLLLESLSYWRYLGTHENLRRLTASAAARAPTRTRP